ncbi:hypothetical protein BKA56DRAFT_678461 [Ilyonectria sp. MPI-CAGE-AT-0026]|nr:hypothetical protein BKA56DRAFT_678461 [Ilyonectria sp. MPI-CAGE-AT-0026]
MESIHGAHVGQAEFYYTCAQVKVTGGGSGVPGPTVKFPGAYKKDDSSFNFSIYSGFKEYPTPGPAVWTGDDSTTGTNNTTLEQVSDEAESTGSGCSSRKLARHARDFKGLGHMH